MASSRKSMFKNIYEQFGKVGYEAFFIIGAIAFVVIFFWPPLKFSPQKGGAAGSPCMYNPPLTTESFQDEGVTYDLLKSQAPIIGTQVEIHTERERTLNVKGKQRKVTQTFRQSDISNWFTGDATTDPLWLGLRYVDVTDDVSSKPPGTRFFDIYIKRGAQVPPMIAQFCKENPTDWKGFLADSGDKSFPPKEIDVSKITPWQCNNCLAQFFGEAPRDKIYYLYAYDVDNMEPIKMVKRTNFMPTATIDIDGTTYTVVYYGGWESKHIRLEATDPLTGSSIGYRYANPERLRNPQDPYKFLNVRETATDSLQLKAFTPWQIPPAGWWTPECKPAIYLYPKNKMNVNVKVTPNGHLTYTDPIYNQTTGWNVTAFPDGKLTWLDNTQGINSKGEKRQTNIYDYLYYESKIHDSVIEKPTEGYIVAYKDLETFYNTNLPKFGLNEKETNDYIEYWLTVLPKADYYFIGLLSNQNINNIEPMLITPNPDSTLRVRLYYEALTNNDAKNMQVKTPNITSSFERNGFTVVEWGGMVKQDKNHPFTCSM